MSLRDPVPDEPASYDAPQARRPDRLMIAHGPPLSGVTRSMYEAAKTYFPQHTVIASPAAQIVSNVHNGDVGDLAADPGCLVWLDDIGPADLLLLTSDGVLDILLEHAVVMVNINDNWFARLTEDNSPLTAEFRSLMGVSIAHVSVPFDVTPEERQRAEAILPTLPINRSIAEALVGGDVVLRHYVQAAEEFPNGHALVAAAADARRAGVHRGFCRDELRRLFVCVGSPTRRNNLSFAKALRWGLAIPHGASVAPLSEKQIGGGHAAVGYLAAADEGFLGHPVREMPEATWGQLLDALPVDDAFHIGVAAHLRGLRGIATAAFTRAMTARHEVIAAHAARALERLEC